LAIGRLPRQNQKFGLLVFRVFSCYFFLVTIEQTVEIPAGRRLHVDLNLPETAVVKGKARVIVHFPAREDRAAEKSGYSPEWEKTLAVLKRTGGAWKDNPWENYREDLHAMRSGWDHRDFWNPDPAKQHRD
jgi:hypothetical protein